jgi:4-amino-4-deoxy-L-arabinose transferase-like glycosyltransferase
MLFGRKLHSYKAGGVAVALFLMDAYVQRINRRGMLETLAMLFVLLGLYIFFTRRPHLTARRRLAAGVAFGLAMLTKEAMFLELSALIAYALWSRRSQLRDAAWVGVTACLVYLPYPLWVVAIGKGDKYLFYELFGITRVLHSLPGYPPANASAGPTPRATFSPANLQHLFHNTR